VAGTIRGVDHDTAVGIVVTSLLGLGALLALSPETPVGLGELLFGDILGVTGSDLVLAAGLVLALGVSLAILHPRLVAVGFDRSHAAALRTPPLLADAALGVLLALTLLVAVQGMGNLLVMAVLVGPAATARLLADRIPAMMLAGSVVAVTAGAIGLIASYHLHSASGATVALALVGAFLLAVLARRRLA
jgi:ABC-type Mn2+/Zn2+ transport system permease subunit